MNQYRISTNAKQIVKNKIERCKAIFVFTGQENYYLYRGNKLSEFHFNMVLPIEPISIATHL